jgi:hypothetical protein
MIPVFWKKTILARREVNNLTYGIHDLGTTNLRTVMGGMDLKERILFSVTTT